MQTILNIKTDKALKESAREVADELGIPLSTAVNSFLRQFVRDREIVFSASYRPSKYLRESIALARTERGGGKLKSFSRVEDLFRDLGI